MLPEACWHGPSVPLFSRGPSLAHSPGIAGPPANGGPPSLSNFPVTEFVTGASTRGVAEGGCGPPGIVDVGVGGVADVVDDDDVDGIGPGLLCCPAPPTGGTLSPPWPARTFPLPAGLVHTLPPTARALLGDDGLPPACLLDGEPLRPLTMCRTNFPGLE